MPYLPVPSSASVSAGQIVAKSPLILLSLFQVRLQQNAKHWPQAAVTLRETKPATLIEPESHATVTNCLRKTRGPRGRLLGPATYETGRAGRPEYYRPIRDQESAPRNHPELGAV